MNKQKGFTIIELIVVIAIIAVLAGIVLVNVTGYINKGRDAAIQGNLTSLLTNAATYFDTNSNYSGVCTTYMASGKPIYDAIFSIITPTVPVCTVASGNAAFCACSALKNNPYNVYCVDSTGTKRVTTTGVSGTPITCATECPAAGACVLGN